LFLLHEAKKNQKKSLIAVAIAVHPVGMLKNLRNI
jgi:hypothetical protein